MALLRVRGLNCRPHCVLSLQDIQVLKDEVHVKPVSVIVPDYARVSECSLVRSVLLKSFWVSLKQ